MTLVKSLYNIIIQLYTVNIGERAVGLYTGERHRLLFVNVIFRIYLHTAFPRPSQPLPVAKFIVPDWRIKSTMDYGIKLTIPPPETMNSASALLVTTKYNRELIIC
jgi:hypothetical protein